MSKGIYKRTSSMQTGKYIRTEETKKRMSEALTGRIFPMLGKKHSQETKRKIGLANKGKTSWCKGKKRLPFSEEWIKHMSESGKKRHISKEHLAKLREGAIRAGNKPPLHIGKDHWNWKGGVTKLQDVIRKGIKYKNLMAFIKARDNFICQLCKKRGGELHTDHFPIPFHQIIKDYNIRSMEDALNCPLMWDENNLRTLCVECHRQTYTYSYKAGYTIDLLQG